MILHNLQYGNISDHLVHIYLCPKLFLIGASSVHHPYFNNHSPSRFQQHQYPNSPKYKTFQPESNRSQDSHERQESNKNLNGLPHYRQAPGTPSKLTITKQQTPSTSLHATSSLLASLDKSILQIRYFHFGKIE